jgi:secondary thiamine-phosphate synthase enzyme
MDILTIKTNKRNEIIDITAEVKACVKKICEKERIKDGICFVYVPHATAAVTINENYDPAVCEDFLNFLSKQIPEGIWKHDKIDNNGAAHIKSALIGPCVFIPIKDSSLMLGTWQGIMLCEFDGPRERKVIVTCK